MVTLVLIVITVAVSFYAWSNPGLFARLMMNPYHISVGKQYYRFITSGLIHKDHLHLIFNMFSFYFFGTAIERIFTLLFGQSMGIVYYLLLYIGAIIVSDMPTYFKQKSNRHYNSLGASGGVSAVVFAFILFQPMADICIYFALCLPGFIMGFLFTGFSYYQAKKGKDNINHEAHLYGALFGVVVCLILYPSVLHEFVSQVQTWKVFEKIF